GASVRERPPRLRHVFEEPLRRLGRDQDREMMVPHGKAVGLEVVERLAKLVNLAGRRVVGGEKLVLLSRQHRLRVSLGQERKGLRDHEFERQTQERIEQAGPRRSGVLLETEYAGGARAARAAD